MQTLLLTAIGIIIIVVAIWGLITGKIIAGSRGLQPNYYYRNDNPFLYFSFIVIYLLIGSYILYHSI